MTVQCEGRWQLNYVATSRLHAEGDEAAQVWRCDGCGEHWVILRGIDAGKYPPGYTVEEAVRAAIDLLPLRR